MKSIKYNNTVLLIKNMIFPKFFFLLRFVPSSSSSFSTGVNTSDSGPDTSQACMIWGSITLTPGESCKEATLQSQRMTIPFVSIGADHACEHLNKLTKIHAGLVGISNNANARQRFFLVTPELSRVAKEFKSQFDLEPDKTREHHDLGPSAVK